MNIHLEKTWEIFFLLLLKMPLVGVSSGIDKITQSSELVTLLLRIPSRVFILPIQRSRGGPLTWESNEFPA